MASKGTLPQVCDDSAASPQLGDVSGKSQHSGTVASGHRQQQEERGSIRDEIRKRLALAEKGDLEQLLRGLIEDQEKQKQQERRSEGLGETDAESD